jgi:hypothetical protein
VRVHASSVNPIDNGIAAGMLKDMVSGGWSRAARTTRRHGAASSPSSTPAATVRPTSSSATGPGARATLRSRAGPIVRAYRCAWHREERARKRLRLAGYAGNTTDVGQMLHRRTAAGRVPCDVFLDPWAYLVLRKLLRTEIERTGLAELVTLENTLNRDRDDIWRELTEFHKPRTIGAVEEKLDQVARIFGDRARLFGNLPRLNSLLALVQLHLLKLDDPNEYARILRDNHLAHNGTPPPRRKHDGAGLRL